MAPRNDGLEPVTQKQRDAAERRQAEKRCVQLRLAGATFSEIAEQLGYSDASGAWQLYQRAMDREIQPMTAQIRDEELRRLDRIMSAYWGRALGAGGSEPSPKAAEVVFKAMDRRAKLLGLDAPVKAQVEVSKCDDGEVVEGMVVELTKHLEARKAVNDQS